MPLTTVIPLKLGSSQVSRYVSGEGIGMAWGGTGVDLSASGGSNFVLAQDASHVISARALLAADIPNLDAAKITTGTIPLARGGTNADLSGTGGTGKYLKQATLGGNVTVVQPTLADMGAGTASVDIVTSTNFQSTNNSNAGNRTTNLDVQRYRNNIFWGWPSSAYTCSIGDFDGSGYPFICFYGYHSSTTNVIKRSSATNQPIWFTSLSGYVSLFQGSSGTADTDCTGTEKYRFDSIFQTDRASLGTTMGSPVDQGYGGLYCSGNVKVAGTITLSGVNPSVVSPASASGVYLQLGAGSGSISTIISYTNAYDGGTKRGCMEILAGQVAGGAIRVYDKDSNQQLDISEAGCVSVRQNAGGRTANFSACRYYNSFTWGHTNTEYFNSIGAFNGGGQGFIAFYAYHSATSNTLARASATNVATWIQAETAGYMSFWQGNTGTVNGDITGTEKYRFGPTMLETGRISLGGTIGSSVDPGAGGISITGGLKFSGAGTSSATTSQIYGGSSNGDINYNVSNTLAYSHNFRMGGFTTYSFGYSTTLGTASANTFQLGDGSGAYFLSDGFGTIHNVVNTYTHKMRFAGTEKYRFSAALAEFDRLSLGGIIGSSTDPSAGGLALTGNIQFAGAGTASSVLSTIWADASAGNLYINVPTGKSILSRTAGTALLSIGYAYGAGGDVKFGLGDFGVAGTSASAGITSVAATDLRYNVASGGLQKFLFAGTEKYRFSAALCEFDRLSLGGTIGSSSDPGAGGIYATGNVNFRGGQKCGVSIKTTTYTATVNDYILIGNHATTAFTITLPAATGSGQVLIISNINAAVVTVDGNASETINGSLTQTLNQWDSIMICEYGTGVWNILARK